ncbi:MAG: hypothetical protein KC731_33880 [Myxococcales bacterium]|nr:hypothetical protein [Myxococcales bacterium]
MALDSDRLLPTKDEQDALIEALGRLLERLGPARFLAGPIFLPSARHFPEPFTPTFAEVRRLAERILAYASLERLSLRLELFDSADPHDLLDDAGEVIPLPRDAAAWTTFVDDEHALIAIDLRELDAQDKVVGILAHEVSHLYRLSASLTAIDHDAEERLTDLTSLYLGFGVFAANNAYRYRTAGEVVGATAFSGWSESQLGYLPPRAWCFLLAIQAALHLAAPDLHPHLDPTQRAMFDAARAALPALDELRLRLGLDPDAAYTPEAADDVADRRPADTSPATDEAEDRPLFDDRIVADNQGRPVLKLRQPRIGPAFLGAFLGFAVGMVSSETLGAALWLIPTALALLGWKLGQRLPFYQCLGRDCGAVVPREAERCPACGGRFRETVDDPKAMLD